MKDEVDKAIAVEDSETAYIYARVPPDLHARVKEAAEERGMSITMYVTSALETATKTVSVPLKVKTTREGPVYAIDIPPEWWVSGLFQGGTNEDQEAT